jgi:hypothetical protein
VLTGSPRPALGLTGLNPGPFHEPARRESGHAGSAGACFNLMPFDVYSTNGTGQVSSRESRGVLT